MARHLLRHSSSQRLASLVVVNRCFGQHQVLTGRQRLCGWAAWPRRAVTAVNRPLRSSCGRLRRASNTLINSPRAAKACGSFCARRMSSAPLRRAIALSMSLQRRGGAAWPGAAGARPRPGASPRGSAEQAGDFAPGVAGRPAGSQQVALGGQLVRREQTDRARAPRYLAARSRVSVAAPFRVAPSGSASPPAAAAGKLPGAPGASPGPPGRPAKGNRPGRAASLVWRLPAGQFRGEWRSVH